jgi:hypothetical protein
MTDRYDCYGACFVIDLITDSPVAHTYAPLSFGCFDFEAAGGSRILSEEIDGFGDASKGLTIKPARFAACS